MPRLPRFRVFALLLALLGSLAVPVSALTHGLLHEHAAHERAEHHGGATSLHETSLRADIVAHGIEIEQQDEHHRHGHRAIALGVAAREGQRSFFGLDIAVLAARVELAISEIVDAPAVTILYGELRPRPDPGGTFPTRLRAPPLG